MARYKLIAVLFLSMMGFAQEFSPTVPQDKTCTGTDVFTAYVAGKFTCTTFAGGGITTLDTLSGATQTFSKTDDTNVTLTLTPSAADHNFALGWTGTLAAGRLNSSVVQAITNDTNITGSIATQTLTLGFTGTLAKARQNSVTAYTDAQNSFSTNQLITLAGNGPNGLQLTTSSVATGTNNFAAPFIRFQSKYYTGVFSDTDIVDIKIVQGTGTSPTEALTFSHNPGSSGLFTVNTAIFDASTGFRVNGAAGSGKYLKGDGNNLVLSTGSASGVGTPTVCTNQVVTGFTLNSDAAPTSTCTTLTSSFLPNTVVYNNATNTGTAAFKLDASASTAIDSFKVPVVAGFAPTANGAIGYDSTANAYKFGVNTATKTVMMTDTAVTASQLPNPSASTLGGIESLAATTHQWINTISTSGVPSATQPAASDITGLAASATTDTTVASNIGSGTLPAGRMPALTGECTTSAGAVSVTCGSAIAHVIASGTSTFTTTAVAASACQTTVTTAATGAVASTDTMSWNYTTAPTAATDGRLTIQMWITTDNVNFMRCNNTAASVTPTALVARWKVLR